MSILVPFLALLVGTGLAYVLHRLTDFLRHPYLVKLAAVLGWVVFCCAISFAGMVILMWLRSIGDPHGGMAPLWGMLGVYLLALLGVGGCLGAVHARRYETTWAKSFGVVMTKFALLAANLCLIPRILSGDGDSVAVWSCFLCGAALVVTFIALEFAPPLSRRFSS